MTRAGLQRHSKKKVSIFQEALRITTKLQSGNTICMPETEAETFRIQDGSDIH